MPCVLADHRFVRPTSCCRWHVKACVGQPTGLARARIEYAESVSLDWKSGALAAGLAHYETAEFFLAHEDWESVWLTLEEPEKSFLQALIQMTAAFHHLHAGNSAGALSLLHRALRRLESCPVSFGGILVTPLCAEVGELLRLLKTETPCTSPPFPQIRLINLPSE